MTEEGTSSSKTLEDPSVWEDSVSIVFYFINKQLTKIMTVYVSNNIQYQLFTILSIGSSRR